jgi:hypothetical protein
MDMTVTAIGAVVAGGLRDAGSRKLASPEAPTLEDASWVGAFGLERGRAGPGHLLKAGQVQCWAAWAGPGPAVQRGSHPVGNRT